MEIKSNKKPPKFKIVNGRLLIRVWHIKEDCGWRAFYEPIRQEDVLFVVIIASLIIWWISFVAIIMGITINAQ